ncbi:MAG: hypothetical protein SVT52_02545, partial [Planctomycetota bacterium]|nr:hypothetical protein [Planctomycetota bacterium]
HGKSKELLDELVRLSMAHGIMTPYTSFLADETTRLSDSLELHRQAEIAARPLSKVSGDAGQVAAKNRQKLNYAYRVPAARGVYTESKLVGHADKRSYEAGEAQTVANVRQVGNQALYRRGRVWVAANAAKLDLEKDAGKIRTIERFGEEYFRLIRANTVAENQLLASQQADEELLIRLRGQVYRIR